MVDAPLCAGSLVGGAFALKRGRRRSHSAPPLGWPGPGARARRVLTRRARTRRGGRLDEPPHGSEWGVGGSLGEAARDDGLSVEASERHLSLAHDASASGRGLLRAGLG